MASKKLSAGDRQVVVFPGKLGWMALQAAGSRLEDVRFGHPTPAAALAALGDPPAECPPRAAWILRLQRQLQAYAEGEAVDFGWVEVVLDGLSPFRRRVLELCRTIPYGKTLTYGQLAAQAGSPAACRAVGACMAANRLPLVIPCHRVVASNGGLGGFSAPGGLATKRLLLELEGQAQTTLLQVG